MKNRNESGIHNQVLRFIEELDQKAKERTLSKPVPLTVSQPYRPDPLLEIGEKALPVLRTALPDCEQPLVRGHLLNDMARIGGLAVLPDLSSVLKEDKDSDVRVLAVAALGIYGDQSAVPLLLDTLDDKDGHVSGMAIMSLQLITGQELQLESHASFEQGRKKAKQVFGEWWAKQKKQK